MLYDKKTKKKTKSPKSPTVSPKLPYEVTRVAGEQSAEILECKISGNKCKVVVRTLLGRTEHWVFRKNIQGKYITYKRDRYLERKRRYALDLATKKKKED